MRKMTVVCDVCGGAIDDEGLAVKCVRCDADFHPDGTCGVIIDPSNIGHDGQQGAAATSGTECRRSGVCRLCVVDVVLKGVPARTVTDGEETLHDHDEVLDENGDDKAQECEKQPATQPAKKGRGRPPKTQQTSLAGQQDSQPSQKSDLAAWLKQRASTVSDVYYDISILPSFRSHFGHDPDTAPENEIQIAIQWIDGRPTAEEKQLFLEEMKQGYPSRFPDNEAVLSYLEEQYGKSSGFSRGELARIQYLLAQEPAADDVTDDLVSEGDQLF